MGKFTDIMQAIRLKFDPALRDGEVKQTRPETIDKLWSKEGGAYRTFMIEHCLFNGDAGLLSGNPFVQDYSEETGYQYNADNNYRIQCSHDSCYSIQDLYWYYIEPNLFKLYDVVSKEIRVVDDNLTTLKATYADNNTSGKTQDGLVSKTKYSGSAGAPVIFNTGKAYVGKSTKSSLGVVKAGNNVSIESDGTIDVPIGSKDQKGILQVGEGLKVEDGVISAEVQKNRIIRCQGYSFTQLRNTSNGNQNTYLCMVTPNFKGLGSSNPGISIIPGCNYYTSVNLGGLPKATGGLNNIYYIALRAWGDDPTTQGENNVVPDTQDYKFNFWERIPTTTTGAGAIVPDNNYIPYSPNFIEVEINFGGIVSPGSINLILPWGYDSGSDTAIRMGFYYLPAFVTNSPVNPFKSIPPGILGGPTYPDNKSLLIKDKYINLGNYIGQFVQPYTRDISGIILRYTISDENLVGYLPAGSLRIDLFLK